MARVVGVTAGNGESTIDLFEEDEMSELVRKGHGTEGEKKIGVDTVGVCPTVGRTDSEDNMTFSGIL